MRAGIVSGDALPAGALDLAEEAIASLVRIVAESPVMSGQAPEPVTHWVHER